jgi:hypothetical protein
MRHTMLALLSAILLGFSVGAKAADEDAKAIVIKAIKAHGGEEALTKYKASQAKNKGKIKLPGVGEIEIVQDISIMHPDMFKESVELDIANMKINIVTMVKGDKASMEANGKAVPITDPIKKLLQDAQYTMKVSRMVTVVKDKSFEFSSLGEIKVEGKPAIGVRISSKGHNDINLFFNKETGLLAKVESRGTDPMTEKEFTEERIILEYRDKGPEGVPLPKRILVKRDGEKYVEAEVLEVKLLEKIDESEFTK